MTKHALIAPMLASPSTGSGNRHPVDIEGLAGTNVFDLKIDGVRAILYRDPEPRLVNRSFTDISHKYPEIIHSVKAAGSLLDAPLDGEIVADNSSFETTLLRDSQERGHAINRLAIEHPCRFVAFDSPEPKASAWSARRALTEKAVHALKTDRVTITPYSTEPGFFTQVADLGMEGVIAKRITSRYQPGRRSPDWVKFKTVRRVSAIVVGYSPGTGSRTHFGNMSLAMLDADLNPVDVGTVGSGFTEKETHELKALLDAGTLLVVEIEALNVTNGGKLRHPVYKGIRSDLSPVDCTTAQLAQLPTC